MSRPGLRRALITAGGTREAVDDVRWLGNVASGALPAAMAEALLRRGWAVDYVHGADAIVPGVLRLELPLMAGSDAIEAALAAQRHVALARAAGLGHGRLRCTAVRSAADAAEAVERLCRGEQPQLVACAMAVADYSPRAHIGKIGSQLPADTGDAPAWMLPLYATEKVIDRVRLAAPNCALLGFKLLSDADEAAHHEASSRLGQRAGADWIFSNDMRDYRARRRCGTLRDAGGEPLLALDGGSGAEALGVLAEALVGAVLERMPVR